VLAAILTFAAVKTSSILYSEGFSLPMRRALAACARPPELFAGFAEKDNSEQRNKPACRLFKEDAGVVLIAAGAYLLVFLFL